MNKKQTIGVVIACLALIITGTVGVLVNSAVNSAVEGTVGSLFSGAAADIPSTPYVGVVPIEGTIGATENYSRGQVVAGSPVDYIYTYMNDPNNTAIMLYIDSTGGGVNETDEIYLALMDYKAQTNRPVYAWCNDYAASGAYYIACAADQISVMRNTWIGSIGVYIESVNYADLMDTLGVEGIYIRSSENKAMGNPYEHLTDEQYAIYQGLVDAAYDQFLSIVAQSRGYADIEQLKTIADGRLYTADQAIENGLADRIESYEEAIESAMSGTNAFVSYTPEYSYGSILDLLFSKVESIMPQSDVQAALEAVNNTEVKLYYAVF